jgi:hypothetical protein
VAQPLTEKLAGNDADSQLEFWHELAGRPVASNDEAFHGLLLYTDREDPADSYEARVNLLKQRKMLPKNFNRPANESLSRGDLAVALVRALEIKGGLTMRALGWTGAAPSPRYATRELMYLNLYPPSSPNQTFSGSEFLGIIGRAEDYQRVNPAKAPAALLPAEIERTEKEKNARHEKRTTSVETQPVESATPAGAPSEPEPTAAPTP